SGAGKTENTKKVITYFAILGANTKQPEGEKKANLEDRIVQTNPILESYGNAKTIRNDNSSRFGKFIRIYFNQLGKLAGGFIDVYLLEKSRVTYQQDNERGYHIFYQLFEDGPVDGLKEMCLLSDDIYDYFFPSQGKIKVDSIDDAEELEFTDAAFDTLGFSLQEKQNAFMLTASILHLGEMTFKQKGREEGCEPDDVKPGEKVCKLCGIENFNLFYGNFIRPKIKVGTEWVYKGQNANQCLNSIAALARSMYNRLFMWLVDLCNRTLIDPTMKKVNFIGVLDIAGFEIFEYNTFEQICINFCNEKLQQFFNHHMFVLEQEEYVTEGIEWEMVDFGMDLEATIQLMEKPMGLMAILEEETLFPKASDKTFEDKLKENLLGKSAVFLKKQPGSKDKNAHFAIAHYAGIVNYNLTNWLDKNKDPLNDTVVDQMKKSTNELIVYLFRDHPGQPEEDTSKKEKGKKGKDKTFKTVSSAFRNQLDQLLTTLNCTDPHFIRCIVPNTIKQPGLIDSRLVLHQLTCNGVLEGIRICRRGFPNRTVYADFKHRYVILNPKKMYDAGKDYKAGAKAILEEHESMDDRWRLGHTKVFFRAGSIGALEEIRDVKIKNILSRVQAICRGYTGRKAYKKEMFKKDMIPVIQRNFRKYMFFRDWQWYYLINHTKPEAAVACSAYDKEVTLRDKYNRENMEMSQEQKDLMKTISESQGDLSRYQEQLAVANSKKSEVEGELNENQRTLMKKEQERKDMEAKRRKLEADLSNFRKDIDDLELTKQKVEMEVSNRDHVIRKLNDEIAERDELINKLNKEKKYIQDGHAKSAEELGSAEEKLEHLNKIKSKLEQTMDEMEDSLEREKKNRMECDKNRRKVDSELKICQESVCDLERGKKDIEIHISKKEKEIGARQNFLEDQQNVVTKLTKQIKELQSRIEANEEELEAERQARTKSEKQKSNIVKELDDLADRLDEASGATSAQIELNKKREAEIVKLRRDLEEATIQHESTLSSLKKKHLDAVSEMSEQIDQLNKMKQKAEKDKHSKRLQIDEIRAALDTMNNEKASIEKQNRIATSQYNEISKKCEEANMSLGDLEAAKKKIIMENADLFRQIEEIDNNNNTLSKLKNNFMSQLDEQKRIADDESKERNFLLGKFRNLEHEVDTMREQVEEESQAKENALRTLSKTLSDVQLWRQRYEKEGLAKAEELEAAKMKLQARLGEATATVETQNHKAMSLEKEKSHLQCQIEEMSTNADSAAQRCHLMEKKAKNFDKVIVEWKHKTDSLQAELDRTQIECRTFSTDLFKVKTIYEETQQQLDSVKKENKSLSNEIKDIMDQIMRKRLEMEKMEMQSALEEAEAALEQEENKVLRQQLELSQIKQEIERRIKEKEEEFEAIKKTHQKALDGMQQTLEAEGRAKGEALRMKKKLEADINDSKNNKKYQNQIKESQLVLENEQIHRDKTRDHLIQAERKCHAIQTELEESKTQLEHGDRQRRTAEQELSDTLDQLSDATLQNQSLQASKRKLESEMQTLHADLEEMIGDTRASEEKAKKAMIDAARLAEELRVEQETAQLKEKDRRAMEFQVKDMQVKLDEAEQLAMKGGRKVVQRLEVKIRELESQLDEEQRRHVDNQKNQRRVERRIKELSFQHEEDQKNHERMQELVDKLQNKIKAYKKQIEEAEEIAALNLAKYRKVQMSLEEAEERADLNEQALGKFKLRDRSSSINPFQGM
ncbi:Myosin heavy chain 1, partial [Caligus rogercresseyi]